MTIFAIEQRFYNRYYTVYTSSGTHYTREFKGSQLIIKNFFLRENVSNINTILYKENSART